VPLHHLLAPQVQAKLLLEEVRQQAADGGRRFVARSLQLPFRRSSPWLRPRALLPLHGRFLNQMTISPEANEALVVRPHFSRAWSKDV
jgi:hypothetical protein